jgi:hypothetical protein
VYDVKVRIFYPYLLVPIFLINPLFLAHSSPKFFSATSAWNTPIPTNATFIPDQVGVIQYCGLDTWDGNSWTVPYYSALPTDDLHPLLYNEKAWINVANGKWLRSGNPLSVESQILASSKSTFPYPGNVYSSISVKSWALPQNYNKTLNPISLPRKFYFNNNMLPAKASDGHIAILQPNGRVLEAYAAILLSSGQLIALSYAITDPKSRGDGWQNGQTASMLPDYAGHIYEDEIFNGINHAMSISIPARLLKTTIKYPAYAFDRNATTETPPYSGNIPMGGRVALPPSLNISSLNLQTFEGKSIAHAAKEYGFIVTDRNGEGITLKAQPTSISSASLLRTWNSKLQEDLLVIFNKIQLVDFPISKLPH